MGAEPHIAQLFQIDMKQDKNLCKEFLQSIATVCCKYCHYAQLGPSINIRMIFQEPFNLQLKVFMNEVAQQSKIPIVRR